MLATDHVSKLAGLFRMLGEPNRLGIVANCLDKPLSVSEIAHRLSLSQSLVSHHLHSLRAARLLKAARRGQRVYYSIPDCYVREMLMSMIERTSEPRKNAFDIEVKLEMTP